jgi:hypothetical protein
MSRRRVHVAMARELLERYIREEGPEVAMGAAWRGRSEAEALAALEADPRSWFVIDPTCDRRGPDGSCLGHDLDEEDPQC